MGNIIQMLGKRRYNNDGIISIQHLLYLICTQYISSRNAGEVLYQKIWGITCYTCRVCWKFIIFYLSNFIWICKVDIMVYQRECQFKISFPTSPTWDRSLVTLFLEVPKSLCNLFSRLSCWRLCLITGTCITLSCYMSALHVPPVETTQACRKMC